jgi:hypothetical protein
MFLTANLHRCQGGEGNSITLELIEHMMTNAITLRVRPEFTGRLTLYIENGKLKASLPMRDDEVTASLDVFIELARRAGWKITEPEDNHEQTRKN